jgi:hypothetical protein
VAAAGIPFVSSLERTLGVGIADLRDALSGEGVLYVRGGNLIPEVTVITKPANARRAARTVDRLARSLAPAGSSPPTVVTVDGVTVRRLAVGPVSILYAAVDGKLVVTDNPEAIRAVKEGSGGEPLSDDQTFQDVRDAAGMPAETNGWLYVNFKDGVPLLDAVTQFAGQRIPADVLENLRPLRSGVLYGTRAADVQTIDAFVQAS